MDDSYRMGFADGYRAAQERMRRGDRPLQTQDYIDMGVDRRSTSKPKRKLSKWQKFVKANSKKKQFRYQSGAKKGKLNLKKMGIAYRRKNK